MNFVTDRLERPAIALILDVLGELEWLPDEVEVAAPLTPNAASLIRWAEPQHTSVIGKQVFIGHYPDDPAPFVIARTVIEDLGSSQTPMRSHRLKSRFRQELIEAIEWITTDNPRF